MSIRHWNNLEPTTKRFTIQNHHLDLDGDFVPCMAIFFNLFWRSLLDRLRLTRTKSGCSSGRIRTYDPVITRTHMFPYGMDYIIILNSRMLGAICEIIVGTHSLVSTPAAILCYPLRIGSGLSVLDFPEFTQLFDRNYLRKLRYFTVTCSAAELPRNVQP